MPLFPQEIERETPRLGEFSPISAKRRLQLLDQVTTEEPKEPSRIEMSSKRRLELLDQVSGEEGEIERPIEKRPSALGFAARAFGEELRMGYGVPEKRPMPETVTEKVAAGAGALAGMIPSFAAMSLVTSPIVSATLKVGRVGKLMKTLHGIGKVVNIAKKGEKARYVTKLGQAVEGATRSGALFAAHGAAHALPPGEEGLTARLKAGAKAVPMGMAFGGTAPLVTSKLGHMAMSGALGAGITAVEGGSTEDILIQGGLLAAMSGLHISIRDSRRFIKRAAREIDKLPEKERASKIKKVLEPVSEQRQAELTETKRRQTEIERIWREAAYLRTPEARQEFIEAEMPRAPEAPMTTISEETTAIAKAGMRPGPAERRIAAFGRIPERGVVIGEKRLPEREIVTPEERPVSEVRAEEDLMSALSTPAHRRTAEEVALIKRHERIEDVIEPRPFERGPIVRALGMRPRRVEPAPIEPITEIAREPVAVEPAAEIARKPIEIPEFKNTKEAITFGEKATPEEVTELKRLREESITEIESLMKTDPDAAMKKASGPAQFYREAIEASEIAVEPRIPKPPEVKPPEAVEPTIEREVIPEPIPKIEPLIKEAKSRIKTSTADILKGERGSFSTETKEGAATFEDFSIVGKDFIKRGADTFKKFTDQMKTTFGEVWENVKHLAERMYTRSKSILADERGEITLREEVPKEIPEIERRRTALEILGIKPKLRPEEPLPKRARSVGLAYQKISNEAKRVEVEMGLEYPKVTRTHEDLRRQADRIMSDQEQLLKTMVKEKNFSEAEGLVIRRSAATGLETLMKVVATENIEKANEMHKTFKEGMGHRLQDLHNEFGRNLESLKEKVGPESIAKAFANLERELNKEDIERFNTATGALGEGNARPMINFLKHLKTTKADPKIMDYVYEYWYNSILSGIPTHVVNVVSNTTWAAWQIGIHKPLLAAIDPLVAKLQKRPTEYFMDEIVPALAGIKRGLKPGLKGAKEVIIKGYTTDAETDKFVMEMGKTVGAFARSPNKYLRMISPVVSFPTRTLRAMDIWANQMNYQAELGAIAKRMEKQGKGEYGSLLKNPTEEMMNGAAEYAAYTTFMSKLGKIGTKIESLRITVPGGRFVVPFVRTIANLVKRGVEMTPGVGALKFLGGKVTGAQVTQVITKQVEGAIIATVIASMFADGDITGDVPDNKAEREAFYRQGKKPWAVKIGDRWVQYRRIEPFNTPIAAVGILYDTWKRTGKEPSTEFAWRSIAGFVNNIIDSSYLSGLTQVLDSVRKADKWPQKLTNMFDRTIASFSPMSSFQRSFVRAIEAIDKEGAIVRKPKGIIETIAAATPFVSEIVPARKNVWGEEVVIPGTPLEQWLPWKTAKITADIVEKEIERLHEAGLLSYPGMPAKYMSIAGKRIDLDDEQYDKLVTEGGKAAKKKLDQLIGTRYWKMLSNNEKASRIQRIIKTARKTVRNKIKGKLGKKPIPGMVPWKAKKKKRPAWQETIGIGKKPIWQKSAVF